MGRYGETSADWTREPSIKELLSEADEMVRWLAYASYQEGTRRKKDKVFGSLLYVSEEFDLWCRKVDAEKQVDMIKPFVFVDMDLEM